MILEYCRQKNVDYFKLHYAMKKKGLSLAEAVKYCETDHRKTLFYRGQPLKEWCRANNVNYKAVQGRLSTGMCVEDAIKIVIKNRDLRERGFTGRNYKYMIDGEPVIRKLNHADYVHFLRLIDKGYSVEEAYGAVK